MTQTFEQVDPNLVAIGDNVRLDPRLDKDFIASIRERGVLEPVLLYRDGDGTLTVLAGQRRTLAARDTGLATIAALVDDTPPDQIDRLVDQYVENEHRAALTNSERIAAIEQLALAGLSDHQIAKRTATPKATVKAAKTAAQAPGLRDYADQLTLDQAAALAEFSDDPDAVGALLGAARTGRFDHAAQRIRNDRADTATRAAFAAQLTGQGIRVIERPPYSDPAVRELRRLAGPDGEQLTEETHADCPGHAAWIDTEYLRRTDVTDQTVIVTDDGDDWDDDNDWDDQDQDEDEEDHDDRLPSCVPILVARLVCTDHAAHGHVDRWASSSGGSVPKKRAADMTETERETARAERRHVIESNKAWKAATDVRRTWLATTFATRKTAPAGAEAYLARVITEGWGHERGSSEDLTLAGFSADDDTDLWQRGLAQRRAVTDALATATPKRALQIGLAVAVGIWENRTNPNTWRAPTSQDRYTLACLKTWGYPTSEVEDRMITDAADASADA